MIWRTIRDFGILRFESRSIKEWQGVLGQCLDVMFWTACWSHFVSASNREKCAPGSGITLANLIDLDLLYMLCPTAVIIYLEPQSYLIFLSLLEDSDLPVVFTCLQWSPLTTVRFQSMWLTIHVILIWGDSLDGNRSPQMHTRSHLMSRNLMAMRHHALQNWSRNHQLPTISTVAFLLNRAGPI